MVQSVGAIGQVTEQPTSKLEIKAGGSCHFCGWNGHVEQSCPMKRGVCYSCGQSGHMARACPNNPHAAQFKPKCSNCQGPHLGKDCGSRFGLRRGSNPSSFRGRGGGPPEGKGRQTGLFGQVADGELTNDASNGAVPKRVSDPNCIPVTSSDEYNMLSDGFCNLGSAEGPNSNIFNSKN